MNEPKQRRQTRALQAGIRPLRELFLESHEGQYVTFTCKLCGYSYSEPQTGLGWALSVGGLYQLIRHMKGHLTTY